MITQKKGELTAEEIEAIRRNGTLFGCDACQMACPYNKSPKMTPISFFYEDRIPKLTREILDRMSKEELKSRALGWRGRALLYRNLDILEKNEK